MSASVVDMSDEGVRLRFHRNEAPLAPPAHVLRAVQSLDGESLRTYPIDAQRALYGELAARLGVAEQALAIGNGADEILASVCRATLAEGANALTVMPTFSMYARSVALANASVRKVSYAQRWRFDPQALVDAADERTRLVLLGNPNNPTCDAFDALELTYLSQALPNAIIAVDEVYLSLSERSLLSCAKTLPNVVLIGSLSKTAGLAGMRVGYAVASTELSARMRREITPFPLGAASIAAARAYLRDERATQMYEGLLAAQVQRSLDAIVSSLAAYAKNVWRGATNFVLIEFGGDAQEISERLKTRGIAVRRLADPELSDMIRISAGSDRDTDELIGATLAVLREVRA